MEMTGTDVSFKDEVLNVFKRGAEFAFDDTTFFNINVLHRNPSVKALSPERVEKLKAMHDELEDCYRRIERHRDGKYAPFARMLYSVFSWDAGKYFRTRW
jgi:hypothetical protein